MTFRIIKKPNPIATYENFKAESQQALKPVLAQHVKQYNDAVKDFKDRPEFEGRVAAGPKQIEIQISLKNGGQSLKKGDATIADLVKWLFKTGTKSHTISPKKAGGVLVFPFGGKGSYSRITPAKGGTKGSGKVSNAKKTVSKGVNHPGFKSSDALERVNNRLNPNVLKTLKNLGKKLRLK